MSASLTAVCNKALADVRADNTLNDIADETDTSAEAQACRSYVYDIIGEVLEEYDWRWSSREKSLIVHADAPPEGWSYRYSLPNDCVVPREVLVAGQSTNTDKNDFIERLAIDGNERTLVTNTVDAILRYTSDSLKDTVSLWPNNFTNCVRHKLSYELALSLKNSPQLSETAFSRFRMCIASARYVDNSGANIGASQRPGSLRART